MFHCKQQKIADFSIFKDGFLKELLRGRNGIIVNVTKQKFLTKYRFRYLIP